MCLRWSERSAEGAKNRQADGLYRGIPFTYSSGSPYRAATFTRRRLRDVRSALRFARLVRGTLGQRPANVILFGGTPSLWIIMTVAVCRLAGSACVLEKSEYPFVYAPDTTLTRLWAQVYAKTVFRLVDGVIVISTCLEEYFLARVRRGARVIRIPILVDLDEFDLSPADDASRRDLLCYVGHLDHPGEVDCLLDAFGEVAARFPQWSLRIIGGSSDSRALDRFRARAADMGLGERVEFTGRVERAELPGLLGEAHCLRAAQSQWALLDGWVSDEARGVPGDCEAGRGHGDGRHPAVLARWRGRLPRPSGRHASLRRPAGRDVRRPVGGTRGRSARPRDGATGVRSRVAVPATRRLHGGRRQIRLALSHPRNQSEEGRDPSRIAEKGSCSSRGPPWIIASPSGEPGVPLRG